MALIQTAKINTADVYFIVCLYVKLSSCVCKKLKVICVHLFLLVLTTILHTFHSSDHSALISEHLK